MTATQQNSVTMIIIDDIRSIVEGLIEQIPWETYNIQIVDYSFNGEQGVELSRTWKPDIVLTDIRMSMLDGIDMAREVLDFHPVCKIIFMTGYSDFEYAKTAVRLGAFDFISKPFSTDEVIEAVLKAKEEVLKQREQHQQVNLLQVKVRESMPLLRQEYFKLLLQHKSTKVEINRRWDFLQLDIDKWNLGVMIVEVNHFLENSQHLPLNEVELVHFSIHNILEETVSSFTKGVIIREATNRFVIICNARNNEMLEALADGCHDNIITFARRAISIGVGGRATSVQQLTDSYQQAAIALSYHFYTGGGVIRYSDISNYEQNLPQYPADEEKAIVSAIQLGNEELALTILDQWYEALLSNKLLPHPQYQVHVLYELSNVLLRSMMEKIPVEALEPLIRRMRDQQSKPTGSMEESFQQIQLICIEGCRMINSRHQTEAQRLIDRALTYINENWNTELTISQCAAYVFISGSYFASLFKKVTGQSFTQYVSGLRLEKAKQFLIEGKSIQEVATTLGYEDRRNFSDMFKKLTGMTPTEYRTTLGYDPINGR
ncbi:helix-turn-helix domain-containing protein [Paenibacillus sp. YYML68]|uniref:helix-turn-helix domain-containing protein n=1 Tax=Paenibacillus sp. YYML68 TaxID=2909250 RepID=UPI00248F4DBD|nr:helix-turn-helix domain-containing protein [Paenibacillus sp. YYML68]